MAIGACSQQNLLTVFADNNVNDISAADMRLLINCLYDNFLDVTYVINDLDTYQPKMALSANAGAELNDKIEMNSTDIQNLNADKADQSLVYTKGESDSRYYTMSYIDANYYDVNDSYNKSEIDTALSAIQQSLEALSQRLDGIVIENGLTDPTMP